MSTASWAFPDAGPAVSVLVQGRGEHGRRYRGLQVPDRPALSTGLLQAMGMSVAQTGPAAPKIVPGVLGGAASSTPSSLTTRRPIDASARRTVARHYYLSSLSPALPKRPSNSLDQSRLLRRFSTRTFPGHHSSIGGRGRSTSNTALGDEKNYSSDWLRISRGSSALPVHRTSQEIPARGSSKHADQIISELEAANIPSASMDRPSGEWVEKVGLN